MGGSGRLFKFFTNIIFHRPMAESDQHIANELTTTVLPPPGTSVGGQCNTVTKNSIRDADDPTAIKLADWKVPGIGIYKKTTGVQHDFLGFMAEIPGRKDKQIAYRVERLAPETEEEKKKREEREKEEEEEEEEEVPLSKKELKKQEKEAKKRDKDEAAKRQKAWKRQSKTPEGAAELERAGAGMIEEKGPWRRACNVATAGMAAGSRVSTSSEFSRMLTRAGPAQDVISGTIHRTGGTKRDAFLTPGCVLVGFVNLKNATLLDVLTVFPLVTSHAKEYLLLERQCYWFAFAAYSIIYLQFAERPDDGHSLRSVHAAMGSPPEPKLKPDHVPLTSAAGTWFSLSVLNLGLRDTGLFLAEYRQRIAAAHAEIDKPIVERERANREIAEERAKREEAQAENARLRELLRQYDVTGNVAKVAA